MKELAEIFGKYFKKDLYKLKIIEREEEIDNKDLDIEIVDNNINVLKFKLKNNCKIKLNIDNYKEFAIYLVLNLFENSNVFLNIKGKVLGRGYIAIEIYGNKEASLYLEERIYNKGEYFNISKVFIKKGSINSKINLNQKYILSENSKLLNLPILNIEEKECKVFHSSKNIKIDEERIFYLKSKGLSKEKIDFLFEKSFLNI